MSYFLNEDWPQARERFQAFWQREILDRCCISIRAPRPSSKTPLSLKAPANHEELLAYWLDPEVNLQRMLDSFSRTYYAGEAYPATTMCLGASVMAEFFGAGAEFRPDTVWYHPVITDLAAHEWKTDTTSTPLYLATFTAMHRYIEASQGAFFVGLPELGSVTDDLGLLRGMQELLLDMIDTPEAVKLAIRRLMTAWQTEHGRLYSLTRDVNAGGCCIPWMQTWAPGPHYQMSCDFSAILSPALYREFIVPEIEAYLDVNEFGVYHLDGQDALKHLETILALPKLKAIQWTEGAGQPPKSDLRWIPYYRQIQHAGKCLILPEVAPHEIEMLLNALSSRGLFLSAWCANEAEALLLLEKVKRWTRD